MQGTLVSDSLEFALFKCCSIDNLSSSIHEPYRDVFCQAANKLWVFIGLDKNARRPILCAHAYRATWQA